MYRTFGAPSGALGGSNGDQSGSESRMSTLIVPLNGLVISFLPRLVCTDGSERKLPLPARGGCAHAENPEMELPIRLKPMIRAN